MILTWAHLSGVANIEAAHMQELVLDMATWVSK